MTDVSLHLQQPLFEDDAPDALGSIAIRVTVLPAKPKKNQSQKLQAEAPLDLEEGEEFLIEDAATPLGSYLENRKGKHCVVFIVNGQRQEALDNSFIIRDLGFKYLRNRMMIAVDVDGLTPEAIGNIIQGSRQGFYKGELWLAIRKRIVATLKTDPDLIRLEQEAEDKVAELQGGDEKVKEALNQLIESHHDHGWDLDEGAGASGRNEGGDHGRQNMAEGAVVTLFSPDRGKDAHFPVLVWRPPLSTLRLRPNEQRTIRITSDPSNNWPAIAHCDVTVDDKASELELAFQKHQRDGVLTLNFVEPEGFDSENYPIRQTIRVTAKFNGVEEPRQASLKVLVRPDEERPPPVLYDEPTELLITSRSPVKLRRGENDIHVRLRWDGKDNLLLGADAKWKIRARVMGAEKAQPRFSFSDPSGGRFSLLISPSPDWAVGDKMDFEVIAEAGSNKRLRARFTGEVVDPLPPPEPKTPRLLDGKFRFGQSRRAPYDLKYIGKDDYETTQCWSDKEWSDGDPGSYKEPTERTPLTLIINNDFEPLRSYRQMLVTKKLVEATIEQRITKYTSHVAYHLYQMYQASLDHQDEDIDEADERRQREIRRVSLTLLKLMDLSR